MKPSTSYVAHTHNKHSENERRLFSRAIIPVGPLLVSLLCASPALAQRTGENAVTSADDAFGSQVGGETIGIYNTYNVRGFSASAAGNLRIEGLYFDEIAQPIQLMRKGSAIHVGVASLDYPFPAPTGISDYRLRLPGNERVRSAEFARMNYGGLSVNLNADLPVIPEHLSLGVGIGYTDTHSVDGGQIPAAVAGAVSRFTHQSGEVVAIATYFKVFDQKPSPVVFVDAPFLPALPEPGRYLGQDWTRSENDNYFAGALIRQRLADALSFRGGVWYSATDRESNFTEVFTVDQPNGAGSHFVVSDPEQHSQSWSGEGQLAWTGGEDTLRHRVVLMVRGRDRRTQSGGSDFVDLGPVVLGEIDSSPEPALQYGPVNEGRVTQFSGGVEYFGRFAEFAQFNVGVQRTDYRADFESNIGTTHTADGPLLYNAAVVLRPRPWLTLYGTYVTGLEESGLAPESATNRGELLPASRTTQIDGGIRISIWGQQLVASLFEIEKPYFNFDELSLYTSLGSVTHRGIEASASLRFFEDQLSVLIGGVVMDAEVSGKAVELGRVGPRPVNVPEEQFRLDINYATPFLEGLSLDGSLAYSGGVAASAQPYAELGDEQLTLDPYSTISLGARYSFSVSDVPVTARLLVSNVLDERAWSIVGASRYQLSGTRRVMFQMLADF